MEWNNSDTCNAWKKLHTAAEVSLKDVLNANRVRRYSADMAEGLLFNYAAKQVDDTLIDLLQQLADEQDVITKYKGLLNGDVVNTGENRKVLHHLTRGQLGNDVIHNGINMRRFYTTEYKKIAAFSQAVHEGTICSADGKPFTDVVQIGIGGSDLGPRAMYLALQQWAKKNDTLKMKAHFISNVDPDDGAAVIARINLEHTLFILVSKSGTTQETRANELLVRQFLNAHDIDPSKQMTAVTSQTSPLANNPDYLESFYMDDFIGGRYSSTSACGGVILSLAFGADVFQAFLDGAHAADRLSLTADIRKNPALLDALIGVYERNILGYVSTAVLPYSQALSRFPAHLQQLDMESNGKSVNRFGEPLRYKTGPLVFGEPGTNGQHSFYQLLHQGTTLVPLQFISFAQSQLQEDVMADNSTSQQKLLANVVAQIYAFACGQSSTDMNKHFDGGRPSSLIFGTQLTPQTLGALLAHFENKVMFQGFIWNVNSFDQEGVQLGKLLAKQVLSGDTDPTLAAYVDLVLHRS